VQKGRTPAFEFPKATITSLSYVELIHEESIVKFQPSPVSLYYSIVTATFDTVRLLIATLAEGTVGM
jgi:hypothetical protein